MNTRLLLLGAFIPACTISSVYAVTPNTLNPDISLTLDGRYGSYSNTSDYALPGFMLGEEASREAQGFYLGHNELTMSSNVDDLFYAKFTTAFAEHEGATEIELEEAYIQTLALGNGLTLKAGRFYSDIGYLNNQHGHAWDFVDAPLIYRGLFANQLIDDGLQISWLAPTDTYFRLGLEATRGERFPAGGATNDGNGAGVLFAEFGGDIGTDYAWQLGFSHWRADIAGRTTEAHNTELDTDSQTSFTGDSKVSGIDFVWKWAPNGNNQQRNLKIQSEYFIRDEDGTVERLDNNPLATSTYIGKQSGWYLQSIYQFIPRWRIGYRYDQLDADNSGSDNLLLTDLGLMAQDGHTPKRSSLMLDYSHSEYSRLRLQLSRDDSYTDRDHALVIQYIVTLGAHGAHRF